jgi:hypothetical protein
MGFDDDFTDCSCACLPDGYAVGTPRFIGEIGDLLSIRRPDREAFCRAGSLRQVAALAGLEI